MIQGYCQLSHAFKLTAARLRLLLIVASALAFSACSQSLVIADDLDRASLMTALQRSQLYLEKLPPDRVIGELPRPVSAGEALESVRQLQALLLSWDCASCFSKQLQARFDLVPASKEVERDPVLFTGYYQPIIQASLEETAEFRFPLYRTPDDLGTTDSYYARREIDQMGVLRGRGLEIAWVKDPIDIFFLQIQGSGLLELSDGSRLHVNYAAQNGRPYRSIGRLLIDQGKIPAEEMSMQRLRRYLNEHPEERDEIFYYNESYVFFRLLDDGPFGSLEVPLTPGRSIATDARLFPRGAPAFIITEKPVIGAGGELAGWQPVSRLVLNQDTGGAIRGPQRVDLFFGAGEPAASEAGYMNRQGRLFFLFLKKPTVQQTSK